jgi:AcrR family transcriptional regulator
LVDAAADIATSAGVDALTMRSLADRCGVGVMTIYGYVRTKQELLAVLADRLLAEIDLPDTSTDWRDQLNALFLSVRDVMLAHPALVPILATQRLDGESAYRGAEVVCGALRARGMADHDVLAAFATLTSFTVGSVQRQLGGQATSRPGLATLPAAEFPNMLALLGALVSRDADRDFRDGLQLIIDAIGARMPT